MYSYKVPEDKKEHYAMARGEDLEASYKDLTQVCGRIRNKTVQKALSLLERAANMEIPILFKRFNKKLGHRRELGGRQGRYPQKAVKIVLKVLNSVIANAKVKGLNDEIIIVHAAANKRFSYPRMAPKGRRFKQHYETARVELVVKEKVETKKEAKKLVPKVEQKTEVPKQEEVKKVTQIEAPHLKPEDKKEERKPPVKRKSKGEG